MIRVVLLCSVLLCLSHPDHRGERPLREWSPGQKEIMLEEYGGERIARIVGEGHLNLIHELTHDDVDLLLEYLNRDVVSHRFATAILSVGRRMNSWDEEGIDYDRERIAAGIVSSFRSKQLADPTEEIQYPHGVVESGLAKLSEYYHPRFVRLAEEWLNHENIRIQAACREFLEEVNDAQRRSIHSRSEGAGRSKKRVRSEDTSDHQPEAEEDGYWWEALATMLLITFVLLVGRKKLRVFC